MKKRELAELVCVITGIYLLILATYMILAVGGAIQSAIAYYHRGDEFQVWWLSIVTDPIPFVVFLITGLVFVFKRRMIATWLTKGWGESSAAVEGVPEVMAAAFAVIGVLLATRVLTELTTVLYMSLSSFTQTERSKMTLWPQIIAHSVMVVIQGAVVYELFFRSKSLAAWWGRLEKKGEAQDAGGGQKP